jgi:hypothetical protein
VVQHDESTSNWNFRSKNRTNPVRDTGRLTNQHGMLTKTYGNYTNEPWGIYRHLTDMDGIIIKWENTENTGTFSFSDTGKRH